MLNPSFIHRIATPAKTLSVAAIIVAFHSLSTAAAPVFDAANGHWYASISNGSGISWVEAKSSAETTSLSGAFGHLVSITSPEEQDFLTGNFSDAVSNGYWLGGSQSAGQADPAAGWSWVTGEAWSYTNWLPGEPNDFGGSNEDALAFHAFAPVLDGHWNDVGRDFLAPGFVVEWEVPSAAVPDGGAPFAMLLVSAGSLAAFGIFGRDKQSSPFTRSLVSGLR